MHAESGVSHESQVGAASWEIDGRVDGIAHRRKLRIHGLPDGESKRLAHAHGVHEKGGTPCPEAAEAQTIARGISSQRSLHEVIGHIPVSEVTAE